MMHLPREERLALAERDGAAGGHPHLDACERCRDEVEALREARRAAASVSVPEPSPLFWDQFSRRVAEAVSREGRPVRVRPWPAWRLAGALAIAALVVVVVVPWPGPWNRAAPAPGEPAAVKPTAVSEAPEAAVGAVDAGDEAWGLVALVAEGAGVEAVEATGIAPPPGAVDEAARQLSGAEREELIRLLRAETAETAGTEG